MSDTVFFSIVIVSLALCYVFGGKNWWGSIALLPVAVVGLKIRAATGSVPFGILGALAAGGVCAFFAWLGSMATKRRGMREYARREGRGMLVTFMTYGQLDGSEAQLEKASRLLETLSAYITERLPEFTIDTAKAMTLLHGVEAKRPNVAFSALYALAASTTHYDPRVVSDGEDAHIAINVQLPYLDRFLLSQNHTGKERSVIGILMYGYYGALESLRREDPQGDYSQPPSENHDPSFEPQ